MKTFLEIDRFICNQPGIIPLCWFSSLTEYGFSFCLSKQDLTSQCYVKHRMVLLTDTISEITEEEIIAKINQGKRLLEAKYALYRRLKAAEHQSIEDLISLLTEINNKLISVS